MCAAGAIDGGRNFDSADTHIINWVSLVAEPDGVSGGKTDRNPISIVWAVSLQVNTRGRNRDRRIDPIEIMGRVGAGGKINDAALVIPCSIDRILDGHGVVGSTISFCTEMLHVENREDC